MTIPTALYRVFGDADLLLYIGISNSYMRRWYQHSLDKDWWTEARRATLEWFPDERTALAAEKAAIKAEHPKYNRAHSEAYVTARRLAARKALPAPEPEPEPELEAPPPVIAAEAPVGPFATEANAAEFLGETPDELAARRRPDARVDWVWYEFPVGGDDDGVRYSLPDLRAYREKRSAA